jgi:membrane glycosyltransferase
LEAVFHSLHETGYGNAFDFFLLSDTRNPDLWVQEEIAWTNLCRHLNAFGRIFYRRRRENTNRKAGNIADFVRKSGGSYEAMLVLDADSLMEGKDILTLVRTMEMSPELAILQTPPKIILGRSPFARAQQFIMAAMGPLFVRGLNYWQLGEGSYWGHNALIRIKPFSEFCELPALPGSEPFGGRIFSHDFVEAALLVREGWQVWLAWDIEGTYEESPPTLVDHLVRDRRWCQGNLQHVWLLMARKLKLTVRMHLLAGVMGYVSSPLWFCFLFFGTWLVWDRAHSGLSDIPFTGPLERWLGLSPEWLGALLLAWVVLLLFGPRALAAWRILGSPMLCRGFGGARAFWISLFSEVLLSMLLAPVIMIAHSQSVLGIVLGRSVGWNPQSREGSGTTWGDAWRFHAPALAIGVIGGWICWQTGNGFFWWMLPVLAGLVLCIPLSVWSSRPEVGHWLARRGIWLTPEQTHPPAVIESATAARSISENDLEASHPQRAGFIAAAIDPYVNAVHISLLEQAGEQKRSDTSSHPPDLAEYCLREGPDALSKAQQQNLLSDGEALLQLHRAIWLDPSGQAHPAWKAAMETYRRKR